MMKSLGTMKYENSLRIAVADLGKVRRVALWQSSSTEPLPCREAVDFSLPFLVILPHYRPDDFLIHKSQYVTTCHYPDEQANM